MKMKDGIFINLIINCYLTYINVFFEPNLR